MHDLFGIHELLLEIFDLLALNDQLHFGLTCRKIWGVAVPVVWKCVNTDALSCLLPDVGDGVPGCDYRKSGFQLGSSAKFFAIADDYKTREAGHAQQSFRVMLSNPWSPFERLSYYNRYIRVLYLFDDTWTSCQRSAHPLMQKWCNRTGRSSHVIGILSRTPRLADMFPVLESLSVVLTQRGSIRMASALTAFSVRNMSIQIDIQVLRFFGDAPSVADWAGDIPNVVDPTARGRQPLEAFRFRATHQDSCLSVTGDSIKQLVARAPSLKLLSLVLKIRPDILFELQNLPRLEYLQMTVRSANVSGPSFAEMGSEAFPSLKALVIMCGRDSVADYMPLLHAISSTCLAQLSIPLQNLDSARLTCELLARKWPNTITTLVLAVVPEVVPALVPAARSESLIPFESLRPLLACRHIERVSISTEGSIRICEHDVRCIKESWPRLAFIKASGLKWAIWVLKQACADVLAITESGSEDGNGMLQLGWNRFASVRPDSVGFAKRSTSLCLDDLGYDDWQGDRMGAL